MSTLKLLLAEIWYRKINFALSLFAVVVAVTLFVAGPMLVEAYRQETRTQVDRWDAQVVELEQGVAQLKAGMKEVEDKTAVELAKLQDETRLLMKDMGFNLMIVHRDTDMSDFWASDFAAKNMPQEYVDRLAAAPGMSLITHLVATLQKKIEWEGRKVLLVGYAPESTQSHIRKKAPMGYNIRPGTVVLGYELGRGRKPNETITVEGKQFSLSGVFPEKGSKEDITIAMHLEDAQAVLGMPGEINQIMALGCNCADSDLPHIRKQLEGILPETRITEFRSIALARSEQRGLVAAQQQEILGKMAENLAQREEILEERKANMAEMQASRDRIEGIVVTLADVVTPLVVIVSAIWVGLLALSNVRERRTEIGLFRALGKGSTMIASLFLGKAVLVGLIGAAAGYFSGDWIGRLLGETALGVTSDYLQARGDVFLYAILGAPLLSALASYLPTLAALLQDPAVVLRDT
jgi:putative ABC transport system permease protein